MRIIGGRWKGRSLAGPYTPAIRPTSDRLRETIFNILAHAYEHPYQDARVLDLFAGTGALALEALSRGAAFAALVDQSPSACSVIRTNIEALDAGNITHVLRRDARRLANVGPLEPFSLIFCDPPYRQGFAETALASARNGGWLTDQALIVVEEATDAEWAIPPDLSVLEERAYGETKVYILKKGLT